MHVHIITSHKNTHLSHTTQTSPSLEHLMSLLVSYITNDIHLTNFNQLHIQTDQYSYAHTFVSPENIWITILLSMTPC